MGKQVQPRILIPLLKVQTRLKYIKKSSKIIPVDMLN